MPELKDRADFISRAASMTAAKPRGDHGITQDRIVLNDYGLTQLIRRTTNKKTGATSVTGRFTIEIESEPIAHEFSPIRLGKQVTDEMVYAIKQRFKGVTALVSQKTRKFRYSAVNNQDMAWVQRRYSGGRMGTIAPTSVSDNRMFNDSGRLRDGIVVGENPKNGTYTINVPANRLDPTTFKEHSQYLAMVKRLQELVPELGDPAVLASNPLVTAAIQQSVLDMIHVLTARNKALKMRLIRDVMRLF